LALPRRLPLRQETLSKPCVTANSAIASEPRGIAATRAAHRRLRRSEACSAPRGTTCASKVAVARYYDPSTAQFLTRDPIEPITQQPYQYANGDPLDQIDPLGLCGHWYDVACQVGSAATAVGGAIVNNAGTLSTVASGLATVAYATCAVTGGAGCGVGLALSTTSTVLSGVATYNACVNGNGSCAASAVSLGLSVVATGAGTIAYSAAESSVANWMNVYGQDVYLTGRQALIGIVTNGLSTAAGIGSALVGC